MLSVGAVTYLWEDLVLFAARRGEWRAVERRARESLACLSHLEADGIEAPEDQVEEAAAAFRYERDLTRASDAVGWLERRGLSVEQWMEWVRGGVLREWWSGELPRLIGRYPAAPADLTTACEVEAVCSGEAGRLLRRLGAGAAAAAVMQEAPADDTVAERISAVERGLMKFAQRAVTPEAVRREFGHRHLEWIRIDCRALGFAERVQAEEAAYCVREDGLSFDAVAVDAHTGVYEERFYVEDLDPEHRVLFTSAVPFELIGPIEVDGRHTIFRIMDKVMPSEQDHELTARARNAVLARALEAEAQSRVTWRWEP